MRKTTVLVAGLAVLMLLCGCVSQEKYDDVRAQNRIQQQRITDLESEISAMELEVEQLESRLSDVRNRSDVGMDAKDAEIAALEADIEKKKELIAKMQAQLLRSGAALPMELSIKLREFADKTDMVEFDETTGMLKFESDLVFELGSDTVSANGVAAIKKLSDIINLPEAGEFDVIIAGHTDDVPIKKPSTLAKHPTNWHLSAHRAIAVLNLMTSNKVSPERVSVQGFGEFRPVAPNKEGRKGNEANRRVEIYLIPGHSE